MCAAPKLTEVKCVKCGAIHQISDFDFGVEEVGAEERAMGSEIFYEGTWETSCKCGNDIEVTYEESEYPMGAQNYSEVTAVGATVVGDS